MHMGICSIEARRQTQAVPTEPINKLDTYIEAFHSRFIADGVIPVFVFDNHRNPLNKKEDDYPKKNNFGGYRYFQRFMHQRSAN
mmetsp:Transcript_10332/g.12529  ORF Transcript_10332/g.12529 Transcript_10332/m.12529 type:complete len:84 (+) Transcript_10332:195-446(+)